MPFKKTVTRKGFRRLGSGARISLKKTFKLEVRCLRKLSKNFECTCSQPREHFPRVISTSPNKLVYHMTRVGKGLHLLGKINPPELDRQVDCIVSNMKRAGVQSFNLTPPNLCYNESSGDLALIDFGFGSSKRGPRRYYRKTRRIIRRQTDRNRWTKREKRIVSEQKRRKVNM